MEVFVNHWIAAHPYLSAMLLAAVAVAPIILWPEVSDGSRGGDASGTGRPNNFAFLWLLAFGVAALLALMGDLR